MNPLNKKGSSLIETVLMLPLFLGIFFGIICFSFINISETVVQWGAFKMGRTLLVDPKQQFVEITRTKDMLKLIPFSKDPPLIEFKDSITEISIHIFQRIYILGQSYDLQETIVLYR